MSSPETVEEWVSKVEWYASGYSEDDPADLLRRFGWWLTGELWDWEKHDECACVAMVDAAAERILGPEPDAGGEGE